MTVSHSDTSDYYNIRFRVVTQGVAAYFRRGRCELLSTSNWDETSKQDLVFLIEPECDSLI